MAIDKSTVCGLHAGSVEYSLDDAAINIQLLIDELETAKEDGFEYVVGLSGNYRGAQYVRLGTNLTYIDEE